MYNNKSDWERMVNGKLYDPANKDIEKLHKHGLVLRDKFNRIPVWQAKRKRKTLEKLIPSAKGNGVFVFAPFYCEYGVNIHVGKECFVNYARQE